MKTESLNLRVVCIPDFSEPAAGCQAIAEYTSRSLAIRASGVGAGTSEYGFGPQGFTVIATEAVQNSCIESMNVIEDRLGEVRETLPARNDGRT